MIAEIKGKINARNTNLTKLREDELTGNFFGNMRYIPFAKGLKKVLKNAIRPVELQNMIDEIDAYYWNDNIFLWDKVRENENITELDVRMDFSSIVIGIEVKYRSGLSSEDQEDDESRSAENSFNQLSREARILRMVGADKKKLLLLLADDLACAEIIQGIKIIDGVRLGYLSWQEVLIQLKKLTELNDFERLVVADIIELLEKKGFLRFSGFEIDKIVEGSMNSGENIFNAFEVVNKTHENVQKFIEFCKKTAAERKEFDLMSPKFLRYKSDSSYWGWNTTQMFLLFQDMQDELLENGWRDGPIYVLEILLYDPDGCFETKEPRLKMAKFEYEDIVNFESGISTTEYYAFTHPLYDVGYEEIEDGILAAEMPEEITQKYWGVKRVVCKVSLLVDVSYENAYDMIFGTFKVLKNK